MLRRIWHLNEDLDISWAWSRLLKSSVRRNICWCFPPQNVGRVSHASGESPIQLFCSANWRHEENKWVCERSLKTLILQQDIVWGNVPTIEKNKVLQASNLKKEISQKGTPRKLYPLFLYVPFLVVGEGVRIAQKIGETWCYWFAQSDGPSYN